MKTKSATPDKFTIGLIQMSMSTDPEDNLKKAVDRISKAAKKGARCAASLSFSDRSTSVRKRISKTSTWQKRFQVILQKLWAKLPVNTTW